MSASSAGAVSLGARSDDPISSSCPGLDCGLEATLVTPETIQLAVFTGLLFVGTAQLRAAREACETERERVQCEIDAFDAFVRFLTTLDPTSSTRNQAGEAAGTVALSAGTGLSRDDRLDRILDRYTETVMAVSHYDEDYGDTLTESIATELGAETAIAVANHDELSPELRAVLVAQSRRAREARSSYVDVLDEELAALSSFAATERKIDTERRNLSVHVAETSAQNRFDAALDVWLRLDELEAACQSALLERQHQIHAQQPPDDKPATLVQEFLYDSLPETTFPVLSRFVRLVGCLRSDRTRMERAIARSR